MDKPKGLSTKRVLLTSFLVDITDVLLNVTVAVMSGSVVMLAQALQGMADMLASGLLVFGLNRSKRPTDKKYPFGYGRELYFWTMIAALVMLVVTGTLSLYLGYRRYVDPQPIENIMLAYFVLTVGLVSNGYAANMSFRKFMAGRKLTHVAKVFNNSPQIEIKTAFVLDFMGFLASVLGLMALAFFQITGDFRFDGVGAIAIGVMLAVLSVFLLDGIKDMLVGVKASDETESRIKNAALSINNVDHIMDMKTMYIGPSKLLVNLEVHLSHNLKTRDIEKVVDKVKDKVKKEVPSVEHMQVEVEND